MTRPAVTVALLLCGVNVLLIGVGGTSIPIGAESGLALFCLNSYLGFALLLGHAPVQHAIRQRCAQGASGVLAGIAVLWMPFGVYAVAADSVSGLSFLKLLGYVTLPPLTCLATRKLPNPRQWHTLAVVLLLWLPLEFGWLTDVWSSPDRQFAPALNVLVGISVGVFSVVCVRGVDRVGYEWRLRAVDWQVAGRLFLVFAPVAILLGLASGFLGLADAFTAPGPLLLMALGIFLVIGVPEELLFRGILQNVLEKALGHRHLALGVTAGIFGLAHLNNGPQPDWRYVGLATLAGWFYGRAYLQTRNLMAPALLHTLVDVVWRGFFR